MYLQKNVCVILPHVITSNPLSQTYSVPLLSLTRDNRRQGVTSFLLSLIIAVSRSSLVLRVLLLSPSNIPPPHFHTRTHTHSLSLFLTLAIRDQFPRVHNIGAEAANPNAKSDSAPLASRRLPPPGFDNHPAFSSSSRKKAAYPMARHVLLTCNVIVTEIHSGGDRSHTRLRTSSSYSSSPLPSHTSSSSETLISSEAASSLKVIARFIGVVHHHRDSPFPRRSLADDADDLTAPTCLRDPCHVLPHDVGAAG